MKRATFWLAVLVLLAGTAANAAVITLNFDALKDQEPVLNYYNGGLGGLGTGPGPNYGIVFSANSLALKEDEAGGSGNFSGEPSPFNIVFFLSGGADTMNVAAGFDTGFSFFYSADNNPGVVNVWSGLNATGTILATLNLPVNGPSPNCPGDPDNNFCHWTPIGVTFNGIAHSVDFGGTANQIGFDNITLGSANPGVPEPATLMLIGTGLVGLAGWRRSSKR